MGSVSTQLEGLDFDGGEELGVEDEFLATGAQLELELESESNSKSGVLEVRESHFKRVCEIEC